MGMELPGALAVETGSANGKKLSLEPMDGGDAASPVDLEGTVQTKQNYS